MLNRHATMPSHAPVRVTFFDAVARAFLMFRKLFVSLWIETE